MRLFIPRVLGYYRNIHGYHLLFLLKTVCLETKHMILSICFLILNPPLDHIWFLLSFSVGVEMVCSSFSSTNPDSGGLVNEDCQQEIKPVGISMDKRRPQGQRHAGVQYTVFRGMLKEKFR